MAEGNELARSFDYPPDMTEKQKKLHKEKMLVRYPDILFQDTRRNDSVCDLIFFTSTKEDWKLTILEHFRGSKTLKMEDKEKLELFKDKEKRGYVCIFPSGKFLIQGNPEHLQAFARDFENLKQSWQTRVTVRQLENLSLENEEEPEVPEQETNIPKEELDVPKEE